MLTGDGAGTIVGVKGRKSRLASKRGCRWWLRYFFGRDAEILFMAIVRRVSWSATMAGKAGRIWCAWELWADTLSVKAILEVISIGYRERMSDSRVKTIQSFVFVRCGCVALFIPVKWESNARHLRWLLSVDILKRKEWWPFIFQ